MTPGDATASRWRTILVDGLGFIAIIWAIPIAIVVIGAPIALIVKLVLMVARSF
jgi:hypothetical protein